MTFCGVPGRSGGLVGGSSGRKAPVRGAVCAVRLGHPTEGHALRVAALVLKRAQDVPTPVWKGLRVSQP
jgi:hypothetical protein